MKTSIHGISWAILALSATLAACGGSDSDTPESGGGGTTPPVGSATGVLTDAAVQGVAYTTSSGVTGTTDAQGQYRYTPGDTVSFTLGALTLGSVPATALVTPIELAAGNDTKLQNLLVMLQSLDSDGVADNGITIPALAAAAVTSSVDLAAAPDAFASSANTALTAAQTAAGISRAITSSSAATAHFLGQAQALLSNQVWVGSYDNGAGILFQRFGANGEYLSGQIGASENGGSSGVEFGTASATSVDAGGFALTTTQQVDTNGTWGLSNLLACERVRVDGGQLVFVEPPASCANDSATVLQKAENDNAGIVGVWALDTAVFVQAQTFVFWSDGRFAMFDAVGDTENNCGGPGVEYGTYSYNTTTRALQILTVTVDTNGCAGLRDSDGSLASFTLTLGANGSTATAGSGPDSFPLFRISR